MSSSRKHVAKVLAGIAILCVAGALWLFLRQPPALRTAVPAQDTLRRDLVQNDGRWYRSGATNPFTGWMVDHYPGGALLSRSQISNGLPHGVSEAWYTNGQMQVREHFKEGLSHGLREKWHENGSRLSQAMIVEGKVTGTFQSWHGNGQLSEQIELKLGQPEGTAWAYYPSGFLKAETTLREGQVLGRQSWKDGERKSAP